MSPLKHFYISFCASCLFLFGPTVHAQNIDIDLLRSINPQSPGAGFWKTTSDSYVAVAATASFGTLAYGIIKNDKELRLKSLELMIAMGINVLATDGLKVIFQRSRPVQQYPNDVFVLTYTRGSSFPSGHTSLAFATATSLALTFKKWYITIPAYLWAGCMGYSRMYLGKHYPSDVLGGVVVGAGSSLLSHWLSKKLLKEKAVKSHKSIAL